jgi:hypothetical protein
MQILAYLATWCSKAPRHVAAVTRDEMAAVHKEIIAKSW